MLFCVCGASLFGWVMAFYQVPDMVTRFILAFTDDWLVVMGLIVLVNLFLGTFLDALPAILIFAPIIHPVALGVGIHPVHLGVVVVMNQAFGLLTPPLGLAAMTSCAVAGVLDDEHPEALAHHDDPDIDRGDPVLVHALDRAGPAEAARSPMAVRRS